MTLWAHARIDMAEYSYLPIVDSGLQQDVSTPMSARIMSVDPSQSYTCCSLCLTIFGLALSGQLFLDPVIWNPWLTLNPSIAMHFLIRITRGAQRYLSLVERGKSILTDYISQHAS